MKTSPREHNDSCYSHSMIETIKPPSNLILWVLKCLKEHPASIVCQFTLITSKEEDLQETMQEEMTNAPSLALNICDSMLHRLPFNGFSLSVRTWEVFLCFVAIGGIYYVDLFVFLVLRHW